MTDLQVVNSIEDIAYQLKELDSLMIILEENYLEKIDYNHLDKLESYEICRNYPYITQLVHTLHDKIASMRQETREYIKSIQKRYSRNTTHRYIS